MVDQINGVASLTPFSKVCKFAHVLYIFFLHVLALHPVHFSVAKGDILIPGVQFMNLAVISKIKVAHVYLSMNTCT
jgi:hypothetical protein